LWSISRNTGGPIWAIVCRTLSSPLGRGYMSWAVFNGSNYLVRPLAHLFFFKLRRKTPFSLLTLAFRCCDSRYRLDFGRRVVPVFWEIDRGEEKDNRDSVFLKGKSSRLFLKIPVHRYGQKFFDSQDTSLLQGTGRTKHPIVMRIPPWVISPILRWEIHR
jgi:hypothetical protein